MPEENEQVIHLVRNWENISGLRVNLKFLPIPLIERQLNSLIAEPGNPLIPDIIYSVGVDASLAPKLAWRDQLLDLSSMILPVKERYIPIALDQVFYRNQVRGERGYYALPLWQADDYIHYRGDLIAAINRDPYDVPKDWAAFWQFWQTAQDELRSQRDYAELYGLGLCMSATGFDTYTSFIMFLDAHNVNVVSSEGELLLDAPENRQKLMTALDEYTQFFLKGYVPPDAMKWTGAGNNTSFLDGNILMTQNLTLSIPLTQKLPNNPYNQDAAARYQDIVTIERPLKPDGTPLLTRKGIKQAIVPKACLHPDAAQEFLAYLIEPANLDQLIQGFKGRVLPVMPQLFENSLWQQADDPHLAMALRIYNQPGLTPLEVTHSAFSEVQSQQLWAKTVLRVIQDGAAIAEASDWGIGQIKAIWTAWESAN